MNYHELPDYAETADGAILCADLSRLTDPLHVALVELEARVDQRGWDADDQMWIVHQANPQATPAFTRVGYPVQMGRPQEVLAPYIGGHQLPPWWPTTVFGQPPTPLTGIVTATEGWALTGDAAAADARKRTSGRKSTRYVDRPDRVEMRIIVGYLTDGTSMTVLRERGRQPLFSCLTLAGESLDAVGAFLATVHEIYRSRGLA